MATAMHVKDTNVWTGWLMGGKRTKLKRNPPSNRPERRPPRRVEGGVLILDGPGNAQAHACHHTRGPRPTSVQAAAARKRSA